jgi:hypothetical protein
MRAQSALVLCMFVVAVAVAVARNLTLRQYGPEDVPILMQQALKLPVLDIVANVTSCTAIHAQADKHSRWHVGEQRPHVVVSVAA